MLRTRCFLGISDYITNFKISLLIPCLGGSETDYHVCHRVLSVTIFVSQRALVVLIQIQIRITSTVPGVPHNTIHCITVMFFLSPLKHWRIGFPSQKGTQANIGLQEEAKGRWASNIWGFTCWAARMFPFIFTTTLRGGTKAPFDSSTWNGGGGYTV